MKMARDVAAGLVLALVLLAVPQGGGPLSAQVHQCSYCHDVHGGITGGETALNREAVVEDVCMTCHGDAGPGYLVGPDLVNDTVNSSIDFTNGVHNGNLHQSLSKPPNSCWDCHGHEADAQGNLFLVPRNFSVGDSAVKTVVFTGNTTQADFTGTDGICYVCHEAPTTQSNGLNGHNGPDVCTTCHVHEGGFQGAGGGNCTSSSCHGDPNGKGNHREIVSEFDRATHHVQLGGAGADTPPEDCTVCHNQDGHPRAGTDFVVLINQNDSSSIAYDRDVTATSVLTPFCLSCHDGGGADVQPTPLIPFSDNVTRPEVDETAWIASSHGTNAACADCHESHGSELQRLFTPGGTIPNTTTNYENEEGFCFQCHDGGTAGTDIKSQFADSTINWVTSGQGVSSIATFNDRHDVQHAASSVSGAKIECYDCHDPHVDNSSRKYKLDPDTSNTPPTWPGQTPLSAFCVDCHDSELPPGRVQGHSAGPMADVALFWTLPASDNRSDKMGVSVTSGELMNDNIWIEATVGAGSTDTIMIANPWVTVPDTIMECSECHRPHPKAASEWPGPAARFDLFSMQDSIRLTDGRAVAYWEPRSSMGNSWTAVLWDYGMSADVSSDFTDETTGGWFCNTCHDRRGMNGKTGGCGSGNCHFHGSTGAGL
ncbi:MAG TPA: cytochrome c3 family protein [Longimicrobiales bacterium]|nr:cytochrome c3 family protein [Longimicrobiales bacterium]